MGIGFSTFVIAVGAILTFAIDRNHSNGFDINAAGIILMIVGAIGLVFTALVFGPRRESRTTVSDEPVDTARVVETHTRTVR